MTAATVIALDSLRQTSTAEGAAIPALEQATADPDLEVRKIAARALAQLTAKA